MTRLAAPVFLLGPAHAGKSALATQFLSPDREGIVLGTATLKNEAFSRRLEQLKALRPPTWETIEVGADLPAALDQALRRSKQVLIDSVGQWLAGLLIASSEENEGKEFEHQALVQISELMRLIAASPSARIVMVSSEIGGAPAPSRGIERLLRRIVGETHQKLAGLARTVVLVNAGIPQIIKNEASTHAS